MTVVQAIKLLRRRGYYVRRTAARLNGQPTYKLRHPNEYYERPALLVKVDLLMLVEGGR